MIEFRQENYSAYIEDRIVNGDFENAERMVQQYGTERLMDILVKITIDRSRDATAYLFTSFMLTRHNTPENHLIAGTLIMAQFNSNPGAYALCIEHMLVWLRANPDDYDNIVRLCMIYLSPDTTTPYSRIEPFVKRLLAVGPDNHEANLLMARAAKKNN
jgi:hypothetical protein